jgi:predicted MFS family arabinose efflux permease
VSGSIVQRLRGSVLGFRDFRLLAIGQFVSTIGDQIFPVAVTIAVLNAGGTATDIGLVLGARWLAVVLFALIGGVWADRLPRKLVMITADASRFIAVLALALFPGTPHVAWLALLVFLVGAGEAFFRPAENALLPSLLPEERLQSANGIVSVGLRSAAVIGPAIAGVLVTLIGVRVGYAVDAATFLVSMLTLLWLHEPPHERIDIEHAPFREELREGFDELRLQTWALAIIVTATLLLFLVIAPETVLLPVIGRERFGGNAVYATSLALFAAGGVIGALIAMRWRPKQPGLKVWLIGLSFILIDFSLAFSHTAWVIPVTYLITGMCWEPFNVFWASAIQREIPAERLARVSSIDWMASFAFLPLGMALTGPAVNAFGTTAVLMGSAISLVLMTVIVLQVPGVREFRNPLPPGEIANPEPPVAI